MEKHGKLLSWNYQRKNVIDDEENLRISLGGFLFVIRRSFINILTNDSTCNNINLFI